MEAIEGIRVSIGAGSVLYYTMAGLFHPARRVREIYWRIYNNMYLGAQESLVPFYPRMENEGENTYTRPELDLVI
jgi:splicing factor 3B subunit 1